MTDFTETGTAETKSIELRELGEGDLDRIAEIEGQSSPAPWSRGLFAGELQLTSAQRLWLVACLVEDQVADDQVADKPRDDEIVGFAGAMFVGTDVHVMNVAVDPNRRRQGYARLLLSELLRRSVANGARDATLEVREGNDAAIALYRRFRLGPVGVRPEYYPDGDDALILWAHDIDTAEYGSVLKRLGGR